MPDNARMKSPTLQSVLTALCLRDPRLLKNDGSINHNELARLANLNQPTVTRILNGESKEPRRDNLAKLAAFFRVGMAQIEGYEEIVGLLLGPEGVERLPAPPSSAQKKEGTTISGTKPFADKLAQLSEPAIVDVFEAIQPHLSKKGKLRLAKILISDVEEGEM